LWYCLIGAKVHCKKITTKYILTSLSSTTRGVNTASGGLSLTRGPPCRYPGLYIGILVIARRGTIPQLKFSGKKFGKLEFIPKTEKKFLGIF